MTRPHKPAPIQFARDPRWSRVREALTRHRYRDRVVVGADFQDLDVGGGRSHQLMMPVEQVLPDESGNVVAGYVNYRPDRDGVIRRGNRTKAQ